MKQVRVEIDLVINALRVFDRYHGRRYSTGSYEPVNFTRLMGITSNQWRAASRRGCLKVAASTARRLEMVCGPHGATIIKALHAKKGG